MLLSPTQEIGKLSAGKCAFGERWHTSTYHSWRNMMRRCYKPEAPQYEDYGGRGITVCQRWHNLANFVADMGLRQPGMTLDRIDNSKGYSPENCRWVSRKEQAGNRRNNVFLTLNGVTKLQSKWAEEMGVPSSYIHNRLHRHGMTVEEALRPVRKRQAMGCDPVKILHMPIRMDLHERLKAEADLRKTSMRQIVEAALEKAVSRG